MPEVAYIQTTLGTHFPVIPQDEVAPNTTCYQIVPLAENFPLKTHVVVPRDPSHVLDSVNNMTTLDEWLKLNVTIESRLFHVKVFDHEPLHQIVRPTNKGLAMVRALLKTVGRFHNSGSALSYPVEFGVNVPADEQNDPEYEIILIEGGRGRKSIREDIEYVRDVIFDKILRFPERFINFKGDLEPTRLPAGLTKLKNKMTRSNLNQMANHYSILASEYRKAFLDAQYDRKKCGNPNMVIEWIAQIPSPGILFDYFDNQNNLVTREGNKLIDYEDHKGHLLRFMRHFPNHINETYYASHDEPADDFKNDEYVECVFSEIFQEFYWLFSPENSL